jgi:hypothetical protein
MLCVGRRHWDHHRRDVLIAHGCRSRSSDRHAEAHARTKPAAAAAEAKPADANAQGRRRIVGDLGAAQHGHGGGRVSLSVGIQQRGSGCRRDIADHDLHRAALGLEPCLSGIGAGSLTVPAHAASAVSRATPATRLDNRFIVSALPAGDRRRGCRSRDRGARKGGQYAGGAVSLVGVASNRRRITHESPFMDEQHYAEATVSALVA